MSIRLASGCLSLEIAVARCCLVSRSHAWELWWFASLSK